MLTARKIGVLMGGLSPEREVSIRSGEAVYAALVERGYDVYRIFVDRDVDLVLRQLRIEVAFLALHGRYGEDGCTQGLLEVLGIPYTGSGVLASALALDKVKTKQILRLHNLPTPPAYVCERVGATDVHAAHGEFGYPCVVKPTGCGSSIGASVVTDPVELAPALELAAQFCGRVLVERFVAGREVSVAVLGGRALGAIEVTPLLGGASEYHFPVRVSPERYRGLCELAEQAHAALGCDGLTSVDLMVSDRGNESILEVNTIPGLGDGSLLRRIAGGCGIAFPALCEGMLARARLHAHGQAAERRQVDVEHDGPERRVGGVAQAH
jgi:D-alanine-D-alanine ligase